MNLIEAMVVADSDIADSNIAAQDHDTWDVATPYSAGDRVCAVAPYKVGVVDLTGAHVFESVIDSNLGADPLAGDASKWLDLGPTNRLRAFDGTIGSKSTNSEKIEFTVHTDRTCDDLAVFGVSGGSLRVQVFTSLMVEIFDQTYSLFDPIEITNQFEFWFGEREFANAFLVSGLPRGPDRYIKVTVDAGTGTAELGALVLGTRLELGVTQAGTAADFRDFSELNEDQYGNIAPVGRDKIRLVKFVFSYATENTERALRRAMRNSGRLVVAYQAVGAERFGTLVYGLITDLELPGEAVWSTGRLDMRGVVE